MSYICSVGTSIPSFNLKQEEIQSFIKGIFQRPMHEMERLLPVFENASVSNRQFVVDKDWFAEDHSFKERNELYQMKAIEHSVDAIDQCLAEPDFLKNPIPYEAIDAIIFVSSTGVSTPSIDAYIMNERSFRDDVIRMPLWGLGCAGGASGLARANEWLSFNPKGSVLVVGIELCGLTFQKNDHKKSNFIGTALFGDGISAALVLGESSPFLRERKKACPVMAKSSSRLKKNAVDVMGWDITDNGFEVVFAKSIPTLVENFWNDHVHSFLDQLGWSKQELSFLVAHPGGKKVLQSIEAVLDVSQKELKYSYQVLKNHGNMSSVTVFYILKEWMKEDLKGGERSLLSALGPGFSSELLSLEWM
ncbi:type III polyketide synthase [Aquibacillus koreensis]|uniref:Type III polyketide synthase n=1 Tax=Aquibacillus koreensis TaxID=279446 RepID=A0A9X4AG78_9BACI|nr:3-oxoacyl-[acyl-carrier-protein] synthase III C-terminal domain-containing protein [Aquibacillus koreensis]MCT2537331.1 type III polyketide synthase [Aquibacillus koreensis]MDC3418777.1 type III polyketide synthase [Aquibacillus koreensis]